MNHKMTFEVNAEVINVDQVRKKVKSIDRDIEQLQEHAKNIRMSDRGNTDIGKELVEGIQKTINELRESKKEYNRIIDEISKQKISAEEFESFAKTVDAKIDAIKGDINILYESIGKLSKALSSGVPYASFEKRVAAVEESVKKLNDSIGIAMTSLKDFNDMISVSTSKPKEVKVAVDIIGEDELKRIDALLDKIGNDNVLNGKSELKINTATASKRLLDLYDKYTSFEKELAKTKDPKQISNIQKQMDELLPTMSDLINRIIQINKIDIDSFGSGEKISVGGIDDFVEMFDFVDTKLAKTAMRLREIKASAKEATEEAATQVSSFTFKNGGIRIPVTIDGKSKKSLETKYNQIVSTLQEYADNHPVNVTMRLFPLNTNRAGAEEITNEMRRIQSDINSVDDKELKTKLNSLYDDLEAQFKKALDLKIKVDLGQDEKAIRVQIKNLQDAIKEKGFTIWPQFKITKEESNKISKALKEIQKKTTFDINKQLGDTAKNLEKTFKSGNVEKWTNNFATGLETVYLKLEKIEPYIETLARFFANAKLSKGSLISDKDVNNITLLSNSIKGLKESIEKITTLDLSKLDMEGFDSKIQEQVSKTNPIQVPIEPDLSNLLSFINQIEDAINSTGINIRIADTILPKSNTNNLKDILQDKDNANNLYLDIYKKLDKVAGNIGDPIKKKISESLVSGLRNGISDTSQMLREGFKGSEFESLTEQIIGDKESLDIIKQVANEATVAFKDSFKESNINTEDFVANIQTQILNSGEQVNIPITTSNSDIDNFINSIQHSVDNKEINLKTNLDFDNIKEAIAQEGNSTNFLSKKEAVEQLHTELNLTKKAAEDLFNQQGYSKTKNKYQVKQSSIDELISSIKEKNILEKEDTNNVTAESAEFTEKEAKAMADLYDEAVKAAEAKKQFVEANQQVLSSILESLAGLNVEGDGFKNLNKIINNLANNKDDRITDMVANLELLRDVLTKPVDDNSFINAIKDIASQGDALKDLANILKTSKKKLDGVKEKVDDSLVKKELALSDKEIALQKKEIELRKKDEISKSRNDLSNRNVDQRNVIGTSTGVRIDRNGNVTRLNQSFTTEEEVGRKITYTQRPDGSYEVKGVTNYKEAIKEATKALLEQRKAEYDLSLEQEKSTPNLNKIQALSDLIQDCTRRIDAATDAAQKFDSEFGNFINDPTYGSKFNYSEHFLNKVQTESAGSFAKLEKDYYDKISKRNTSAKTNANKYAYDIQFEIDNGNHTEKFNTELRDTLVLLNAFKDLDINIITEQDIEILNQAISKVKELNKEGKLSANKQANENSIAKGLDRINKIFSNNTKMSFRNTQVYNDLRILQQEFQNFDTSKPQSELDELNTRLNKTIANFDGLDNVVKGKNIFQTIGEHMRSTTAQLIAQYLSFQDLIRYARTMISTLVDLDTQLIDLRKTTTMSASELDNFYHSSSDVAKQLGVTTSEIISQAAAWSRLGYSSNEAATLMAKLSSQFASISPGASTEDATNYLVSTMQAFGIAAEDVKESIMDNVNIIGNTMATSNAEIGEMLERSSAAMKAANNSIEETIALESAAVQITRNAEMTGTAFRTISMRIRGYDEDTEDFSKDLENISGDIADLTKISGKGGISIFTDSTRETYKSTYQILKEISEIWDELTDKQQAQLLEKLGGKRGAQSLAGLLSDFSAVEQAMETMKNSAGSADREMGIIEQSLSYKINALKETWVGTLTDMADTSAFGNILDFLTTLSEKVGDTTSSIGLIGTAIGVGGTIWGTQHLGLFSAENGKVVADGKNGLSGILSNAQKKDNSKYLRDVRQAIDDFSNNNGAKAGIRSIASEIENITDAASGASDSMKYFIQQLVDEDRPAIDALGDVHAKLKAVEGEAGSLQTTFANIRANLANFAISAGISAAISLTIAGLTKLYNSDKELAKATQEVSSKFKEQKSQLTEYSDETIKLRKIIDDSTSSLDEKREATSRLYEIQNDLITQYGSYHNSLDIINDDLETQLNLLQEINRENSKKAIDEINTIQSTKTQSVNLAYNTQGMMTFGLSGLFGQNAGKVFSNVQAGDNWGKAIWDALTKESRKGENLGEDIYGKTSEQISELMEKYNPKFKTENKTVKELAQNYEDVFKISGDTVEVIGDVYELNDAVTSLRIQLEDLGITDEETFKTLDKWAQESTERINENGDTYDTIIEDEIHRSNELESAFVSVNKAYTDYIKAQNSGDTTKVEEAAKAFKDIWGSIEIDDKYKDYLERLYPELKGVISEWDFEYNIHPRMKDYAGLEDELKQNSVEELKDRYNRFVQAREGGFYIDSVTKERFEELENEAALAGYATVDAYIEAIKSRAEFSEGMQSIREAMGENWDEAYEEIFSDPKYADALKLPIEFKPKPDGLDYTKEEIEEYLNPIEVEIEPKVKSSDAVNSMADAKTAITSLESLYSQTVKKIAADGQATGFADPALMNSVESSFSKFSQSLEENGDEAGAEEINLALEKFEDTLVRFPNDAEKAQKATDDLITAYIDQTDIIKNLTEENAEWSEAQLEAYGITNAHEVVQSRLAKQSKYTAEAISELSKAVQQYNSVMEDSNADSDSKAKALSDLTGYVNNAIANYDENGNISDNSIQVNDQFVKQHLADVQAMAEGDEQALERVRTAATRAAIMDVFVNIPTDAAEAQVNQIMDKIAEADAMDIETGAYIDDAPFLASLANMMSASDQTAEAVTQAFESMGYEVQWIPRVASVETIEYIEKHGANGMPSYIPNKMREQISLPELRIKSVGGGRRATAHYGGGTPKGGGGGGNGGGSGSGSDSSKDESEQTFDWVEVAIQRVEDQINHLDEAVENVYSMWGERNKTLRSEIDKTTEELNLQKKAAEIYLAKANSVGLSKAYKTKVQQGEAIDIKSIETIKGKEDLVNKIQEYQQWWEKYKQAEYQQQTLEIKLGDQYKKNFEQFKENYEEQVSLVNSYADLIDKRLNRVQEKGYFESTKYYEELKKYENQNIKTQQTELDKLIKARDEAVASGRIKYGSQAWREMTEEIYGVASAIEESTTKIIQWDKQIRQLKWDIFDFTQERIDQINQEADFIVDLLDNQKMFEDDGRFNERGEAATAMHASKYNVYMKQADDYAKERAKIEKQLADDPADKELIKRKEELIKLQQESIANAYKEKEAVKDLVQEGRYLLSINLFNCWKTLKTIKPQRKDEISLTVMVKKLIVLKQRTTLLFFLNG